MRVDVLLKALCLVKTRSLAKTGCENGRIKLNGRAVKPSAEAGEGDVLEICYPQKVLVVRLKEIPSRQVPRKDCGRYLEIVRETPFDLERGGWDA
ncbi:MAG: hypothetical protein JXB45_12870 [Candidatus Krumholzibacteriota bacterium]|nr:hypothetical protein [Candidatus Krumholzibacteriota bacterium]